MPSNPFHDYIRKFITWIGDDPKRPGLIETPERVQKSWMEMFSGYQEDPKDVLKTFEDGAENYNQIVLVKDIEFTSFCEHHLLPFFGTAAVGYIPDKKIVGLSKLARLFDVYAKRLQVQERITTQVTSALVEHLAPLGAACVVKAKHLCMECRGVRKTGAVTVTSSLTGAFMNNQDPARSELLKLMEL